ncbi:uncharacterized protein VTP21DRAFT_3534 [Calcarisporiella thermophila]|uniref:uncharacterized protein n=1 Tax=Calcarisporiella thermophila TaxID=911321 RepID=UPI0037428008
MKDVSYYYDNISAEGGYVAIDDVRKVVVVAFSWLMWPQNIAELMVAPHMNYPKVPGAKVHSGAYMLYRRIRDKFISMIMDKTRRYPAYDLEVIGWSLGGMMACYMAADLYDNNIIHPKKLYLITLGPPAPGNIRFADYYSNAGFLIKSLVNANDFWYHLFSLRNGRKHFSPAIYTDKTGITIQCKDSGDPRCSGTLPPFRGDPEDHMTYYGLEGTKDTCAGIWMDKLLMALDNLWAPILNC